MFTHKLFFRVCLLAACCVLGTVLIWAQDDEADLPKPDFLTVRLFAARVAPQTNLSEQLFRLKTASQSDDEKWCANVQKAYPGAEISLLQTYHFRAFKSPRPSIVMIGDSAQAHQELHILTALGFGEGDKVVTMTIAELSYFPTAKKQSTVPFAVANQSFESTPGMTYFFTRPEMKLTAQNYSRWLRERNFVNSFEQQDHYLIVSVSYEVEAPAGFIFDLDKANHLPLKASKKTEPQWPAEVKQKSLGGNIRVKALLTEGGKVASASIWRSSLPEGNQAALAAAAKWEFPVTELSGAKLPAVALIPFAVPVPPSALLPAVLPAAKPNKNTAAPKGEAQTAPPQNPPVKAASKAPAKKVLRK